MREHILSEIRRLAAANGGQPPGVILFNRETGIAEHQWRGKIWARWGDALSDAGLAPNELQQRLDTDTILTKVVAACRHFGRLPTNSELSLYRKIDPTMPSPKTIALHFGGQAGLVGALANRAADDLSYSDLVNILPDQQPRTPARPPQARSADGFVYLIKSGDFYKIGRGDDLERRVKQITVALPDKATLVHSIRTDDPSGIEAYWHRRFAEKRANGEWFKLSSLDVSAFKKRKFQ